MRTCVKTYYSTIELKASFSLINKEKRRERNKHFADFAGTEGLYYNWKHAVMGMKTISWLANWKTVQTHVWKVPIFFHVSDFLSSHVLESND